jgi:hypothetical protein
MTRLTFEGQAIVDSTGGGVRFAGQYCDRSGTQRIVICRVDGDVLMTCGQIQGAPSAPQLLAAYRAAAGEINKIASAQFYAGEARPRVTLQDLPAPESARAN